MKYSYIIQKQKEKVLKIFKKAISIFLHANIDVYSRRLISEFTADGVKCVEKLQLHFSKITFSDNSRYDKIFQQVTHKGRKSEMNYIKIFQNSQALSVSVGNNYSEYQLLHIFLDNFHQGGNILLK